MKSSDITLLYVVVFMIVFLSYVLLQIFMDAPKKDKEDLGSKNLPLLFRIGYRILSMFTDILGTQMVRIQKHRANKIKKQLLIANIHMNVEFVFVAEIILGLFLFLIPTLVIIAGSSRVGMAVFIAFICGAVGFIFPSMSIANLAGKRQNEIMRNLPFAIDLIGSAMRSGLDFSAAIRYYVSTENPTNPLAIEFGIMLRQLELGKTRIEALDATALRIQTEEFNSFCAAVAHGTEVGASIVETLKIQAEEMRRARFNLAERKAARAPSIMIFPIVLFIMPAVFIVIGTPVFLKLQESGLGAMMK